MPHRSPDSCPRCGDPMIPVLDPARPAPSGVLPADPPVRLGCPDCSPSAAPVLPTD